jgi:predicted metal-dependent hydrolase
VVPQPDPASGGASPLDRFLALYAAGRFYDAHEALEERWRRSEDPAMRFLQGLIQWAVAFEHHRRGNAHGARVLLERAWSRLGDAPEGYMGIDLSACRSAHPGLAAAFARWAEGGPRPRVAAPPIRRLARPRPRT